MMKLDVDELVELDRLNMGPVIERAGGKFDPQFRRSKLLIEQERGAEFVCVGRQGKTVAYLEYIRDPDGDWKVLSIQVHPSHQTGFVLRDLLSEAHERLLAIAPAAVHSSVHLTNGVSLSLHRKLGFEEMGKNGDRVLFSMDAPRLCQRLIHFHRRKTTANKAWDATRHSGSISTGSRSHIRFGPP